MEFYSKWITTSDFASLKPIDVFHREHDRKELKKTPQNLMNNHCYFRKSFNIDSVKGRYTVNISADDYYKLYINGCFVCQGPASGRYDRYYYNAADITSYLKNGKNVIAVHVYYQGCINRVWNSGDNRQGVIADVFSDGNYIFGTDETWLYSYAREYTDGGTVGYFTQYLENIDFNLAQPDWNKPNFDDSTYKNAVVKIDDDHIFCEPVPSVDVYTIQPERLIRLGAGHYFADFGKIFTGQLHFYAKGACGQKVRILCGEETLENACRVRYKMRCNCDYDETCILSGRRDEFLFFDYKSFRYAEIITDDDCIDIESVNMIVRHHRFDKSAVEFRSSNSLLNKIWDICSQALMIAAQEVYVDCPSREKGQYLGDFCVSGLAHMYLTGDSAMYKKALFDFADSCRICKGMMAVAPGSFMQEIADFSLIYPHEAANYLKYTNDSETIIRLIPIIDGILEYFSQFDRGDGLLENVNTKWNLVDWPVNLRDEYDFKLTNPPSGVGCHNVVNAYYCGAVAETERIKASLGIDYQPKSADLFKKFVSEFYKPDMKLFTDTKASKHASLHSNVLPLFFGIAPDESKSAIKNHIMTKGLCCGVWFSYFVLKALAKIGAYDCEYELITNTGIHSWYNMLSEGATTCFEAWGKEQKWNTSLCHPWASAPIIAIIEDIAGIDPVCFYENEIKLESHIPEGVTLSLKLPKRVGNVIVIKKEE